ncbi:MAG TPA: MEDS domain-containing protein, partial [Polyangiaceae bacterium]|nr:MEDS domain-containing protein [Polyangiaceae bacterium]
GIEQLLEYEATVSDMLSRAKTPTVCVYDAYRLGGGMLVDLLRAHPLTVMNGVLHENPFYTPPNEMLHELRRRPTTS